MITLAIEVTRVGPTLYIQAGCFRRIVPFWEAQVVLNELWALDRLSQSQFNEVREAVIREVMAYRFERDSRSKSSALFLIGVALVIVSALLLLLLLR